MTRNVIKLVLSGLRNSKRTHTESDGKAVSGDTDGQICVKRQQPNGMSLLDRIQRNESSSKSYSEKVFDQWGVRDRWEYPVYSGPREEQPSIAYITSYEYRCRGLHYRGWNYVKSIDLGLPTYSWTDEESRTVIFANEKYRGEIVSGKMYHCSATNDMHTKNLQGWEDITNKAWTEYGAGLYVSKEEQPEIYGRYVYEVDVYRGLLLEDGSILALRFKMTKKPSEWGIDEQICFADEEDLIETEETS